MLNKGEKVHHLRQHIRFGRQGTSSREQHELTALCHELHHQLERSLPDRDHRPARTRTPSSQRDRSGTHLRGALRARQPARPHRFNRRGPADGRLRRLRPANINRLQGGEVASATQNRSERDGDYVNRCRTRERNPAYEHMNSLQIRRSLEFCGPLAQRLTVHEPLKADGDKCKPLDSARLLSEVLLGITTSCQSSSSTFRFGGECVVVVTDGGLTGLANPRRW
jgi:hypothetical protein